MSDMYGKYYSPTLAGVTYHGSTAVGGVLVPISTTTSPTFGLWNPAGSGKNAILIKYKAGWVSTTGDPGTICYSRLLSTGSSIATGAPISVFNSGTPTNGVIGSGVSSSMRFCPAGTTTLTTAGAVYATSGYSQLTTTGATTSAPMWQVEDDFDGTTIIPPGVFWYTTGTAALLSLFVQTLSWIEVET